MCDNILLQVTPQALLEQVIVEYMLILMKWVETKAARTYNAAPCHFRLHLAHA